MEISSDLLAMPHGLPKIVPMCGGDGEYDIDWDVELDNVQSDSFQRFITDMDSILERLRVIEGWRFLSVALLFFRYAFVSKGRQQLLANITVVEALLGEQKGGRACLRTDSRLLLAKLKANVMKLRSSSEKRFTT